jgi:thioredoxin reductase (NADPH)
MLVPIIGGGPAGMSCALWLANYGLTPVIVEQAADLGGIARSSSFRNHWLLGRPGETGRENADAFARHIRRAAVECLTGARPQRLRRERDGTFALDLALSPAPSIRSLSCEALVIATGTRFRGQDWLDGVPNARRLAHRVHIGPPWAAENGSPGSHVVVVGGGDNAFDVSRMLVEKGVRTTVVMRSARPRAQPLLVERLRRHAASGMADVLAGRTVAALDEAEARLRVRLEGGGEIEADHVLLLFGYRPNSDEPWLADLALARDDGGYFAVDGNMETSCRGVFAIGDVANPAHPCIATAIASGTMAAREIQRRFNVQRPSRV